jgi:hypothetical protein
MKVSSPVGDLPFEPLRLRLQGGALVLEGEMGAWPARVEFEAADVPRLARLFRLPLLAMAAIIALALILVAVA